MTDQEINAGIAEFLGRKYHKPTREEIESGSYYQYEPDYCNDLNAMAAAWTIDPPKPFTDSFNFRCELAWQLRLVVERDYNANPFWKDHPFPLFKDQIGTAQEYWIANATARQRAEAFLRTIGKWVETPDERQSADLGIQTQKQH